MHEVMWAIQSPDVYAGETCDKIENRWEVFAEFDKGDTSHETVLELDANHFPAGTRISIQFPVCQTCGMNVEACLQNPSCDFCWNTWLLNEFS